VRASAAAKAVVVHDLSQALAALATADQLQTPLAIWSAPGAASYAGVGWFAALARICRAKQPKARVAFVLDCADRADLVQEAFRMGLRDACFTGRSDVAERLADIARKSRSRLHRKRVRSLDLSEPADNAARLRNFLAAD
jgi:fructose/tagatose bisphosphate aldolase